MQLVLAQDHGHTRLGRHHHHSAAADPFGHPASASWEECRVHCPPSSPLSPLGAPSFPIPLPKPTPGLGIADYALPGGHQTCTA